MDIWRFKNADGRHVGPVAEDFARILGFGNVREDGTIEDKYLSAGDVAGVALAGVKELNERNRRLEREIAELKALVQMLAESKR